MIEMILKNCIRDKGMLTQMNDDVDGSSTSVITRRSNNLGHANHGHRDPISREQSKELAHRYLSYLSTI